MAKENFYRKRLAGNGKEIGAFSVKCCGKSYGGAGWERKNFTFGTEK